MINVTKITIDSNILNIWDQKDIFKHIHDCIFSKWAGALLCWSYNYNIHCINYFLPYYAFASSEESG